MSSQPRFRSQFESSVNNGRIISSRSAEQIVTDEPSARAFVKWCNFHLSTVGDKVTDLSMDFRDGKRLLKLLEVVSGEKLPPPERASMRIHYIQNVAKSLRYLETKLGDLLANCSAEDIVDGNVKLTLAVLYQVTRFQLQVAADDPSQQTVDQALLVKSASKEAIVSSSTSRVRGVVDAHDLIQPLPEKPHADAKASILAWCNSQIATYVEHGHAEPVNDFSFSWRTGLAFSALLHRHDRYLLPNFPQLAEQRKLGALAPHGPPQWADTLKLAFKAAEKYLNIPQVLEPEDLVDAEKPDEKIVLACLTGWYSTLSKIQRTQEWQEIDKARWQEADPLSFTEEGLQEWEENQKVLAPIAESILQSAQLVSVEPELEATDADVSILPESADGGHDQGQVADGPLSIKLALISELPTGSADELDELNLSLQPRTSDIDDIDQAKESTAELAESETEESVDEGPLELAHDGTTEIRGEESVELVREMTAELADSVLAETAILADVEAAEPAQKDSEEPLKPVMEALQPVSPPSHAETVDFERFTSPELLFNESIELTGGAGEPIHPHYLMATSSPHASPPVSDAVENEKLTEQDAFTRELDDWISISKELRSEVAIVAATASSLLEADRHDREKLISLQDELVGFQEIIASAAQEGRDLVAQATGKYPLANTPFDAAIEKTRAHEGMLEADYALTAELIEKVIKAIQSAPKVRSTSLVFDKLQSPKPSPSPRMSPISDTGMPESPRPPAALLVAKEYVLSSATANTSEDTATDVEVSIFSPSQRRMAAHSTSGSGIVVDGWIASAESFIEDCERVLKEQREAALDLLWKPSSIDKRSQDEKDVRYSVGIAEAAEFQRRCNELDEKIEVALGKGRTLLAPLESSSADEDLIASTLVESVVQRLESAVFIALKASREYSRLPTQTRAARFYEEKARKFFHAVRNVESVIAAVPTFSPNDVEQDPRFHSTEDVSCMVYEALRKAELELEPLAMHFEDLERHRFSITPLSKSIVLLAPEVVAQFELDLDDTLAVPRNRLFAAYSVAATLAGKARNGITAHCKLRPAVKVASEASQLMDVLLSRLQAINAGEITLTDRQRRAALSDCYSQIETMVKPKVEAVRDDESYPFLQEKLERLEAFKLAMVASDDAAQKAPSNVKTLPALPPRAPELPERVDSKTRMSVPRQLLTPSSPTQDSIASKQRGSLLSWMERKVNRKSKRRN